MLTIFAIPKPFRGDIKVIQTNAILSWLSLRPKCELILLGNEEDTAEVASRFGMRHIPDVECNEYGTPLVNSVFNIAQSAASYPLMCYVNADIILMSDFLSAISRIKERPCLMVGRRWDIDLSCPVDFDNPNWEIELQRDIQRRGKLHGQWGLDYFVFPRGFYRDIPPFAIGRGGWDNWLVYRARLAKVPVIDATRAITAVHQNHDYSHHPLGEKGVWEGAEAEQNRKLSGGNTHTFGVNHATYILTKRSMRRALSLEHLCYGISAVPALMPRLHFLNLPLGLPLKGLKVAKKLARFISGAAVLVKRRG